MNSSTEIESATSDPKLMEDLYQASREAGAEAEFRNNLLDHYTENPANLLLAAWYYRFLHDPLVKVTRRIPWVLVIALGALTGLSLWAISDPGLQIKDHLPLYALLWSPIATILCLVYLSWENKQNTTRAILSVLMLILSVGYVLLMVKDQPRPLAKTYLDQMAIHIPLLCWVSLGFTLTGFRSTAIKRFAFLTKSLEVAIAAGLFLIFGVVLGLITIILFSTLDVNFPDIILRLIGFGGFGLLPILAVATIYDPTLPPETQDFGQGLSKFITILMRLLLPVTLIILVVYIIFIPFNFMSPFKDRDVLIIFNVVLFAIMGLLIGVTPLSDLNLSPLLQTMLRRGIIIVVCLTSLVSLYAIAAIVYRSTTGITMNRLTVLGWNTINLSVLLSILYLQWRKGKQDWIKRLHQVFNRTAFFYAFWCMFLIIAIPILYR